MPSISAWSTSGRSENGAPKRVLMERTFALGSHRMKREGGLTFDVCQRHADCRSTRRCVAGDLKNACKGGQRSQCFCLPPMVELCKACEKCTDFNGEVCLRTDEMAGGAGVCGSKATIKEGILNENC